MSHRHLLAGCIAVGALAGVAAAQVPTPAPSPVTRPPAPVTAPTLPMPSPKPSAPLQPSPVVIPPFEPAPAPAPVIAPAEAPGYSDVCRVEPKPPWCREASVTPADR